MAKELKFPTLQPMSDNNGGSCCGHGSPVIPVDMSAKAQEALDAVEEAKRLLEKTVSSVSVHSKNGKTEVKLQYRNGDGIEFTVLDGKDGKDGNPGEPGQDADIAGANAAIARANEAATNANAAAEEVMRLINNMPSGGGSGTGITPEQMQQISDAIAAASAAASAAEQAAQEARAAAAQITPKVDKVLDDAKASFATQLSGQQATFDGKVAEYNRQVSSSVNGADAAKTEAHNASVTANASATSATSAATSANNAAALAASAATSANNAAALAASAAANATRAAEQANTAIENLPAIPTKTSELVNDSGFITLEDVPSGGNEENGKLIADILLETETNRVNIPLDKTYNTICIYAEVYPNKDLSSQWIHIEAKDETTPNGWYQFGAQLQGNPKTGYNKQFIKFERIEGVAWFCICSFIGTNQNLPYLNSHSVVDGNMASPLAHKGLPLTHISVYGYYPLGVGSKFQIYVK